MNYAFVENKENGTKYLGIALNQRLLSCILVQICQFIIMFDKRSCQEEYIECESIRRECLKEEEKIAQKFAPVQLKAKRNEIEKDERK